MNISNKTGNSLGVTIWVPCSGKLCHHFVKYLLSFGTTALKYPNNYYKKHLTFISQREIMKITVAVSLPQEQWICTSCHSQHPTLFSMANISTTLQGHLCPAGITTPRGPGGVDRKTVHVCWHWIWENVLSLCAFRVVLQVTSSHLWFPDSLAILPKDFWCISFPLNSQRWLIITKNISFCFVQALLNFSHGTM